MLITGADELAWLADRESIDDATTWALDVGPRLVIVKDGEHGARVSDRAGTESVAAVPIAVVDPDGAGDAFVAGFLSGLLQGRPVTPRCGTPSPGRSGRYIDEQARYCRCYP